jgi:hypothetical protein
LATGNPQSPTRVKRHHSGAQSRPELLLAFPASRRALITKPSSRSGNRFRPTRR